MPWVSSSYSSQLTSSSAPETPAITNTNATPLLNAVGESGTKTVVNVTTSAASGLFHDSANSKSRTEQKIERTQKSLNAGKSSSNSSLTTARSITQTARSSYSQELLEDVTQKPSHDCTLNCKECEALQCRIRELEQLQRLEVSDALRPTPSKFETPVQLLIRRDEHEVAQETLRHTRSCQRHNRFGKGRRRRKFRSGSKHRHDEDRRFLNLVEEYKDQKLETECICELTRWTRLQEFWYEVRRILHIIWRILWTLCPPLPHCCLNKIMFWPPQREYFFFESDEPVKRRAEAAQRAKLKIRRAKDVYSCGQIYRFGFEHQCAAEIEKVDCFFLRTSRNSLIACVFVRSPYRNARYTIVYAHPNASDISDHLSGCPSFHEVARFLNCDIISFDYSGYGISSGRPTEANVYADALAVFDYLIQKKKVPMENIILFGYSIGTAAMIDLAVKFPEVGGVILLASPTSIVRTLYWNRACCCRRKNPCENPKDCCCDRFRSIRKIEFVTSPTLFIHGMGDFLVPVEHSQALFKRAPNAVSPLFVPELGHNNLENSKIVWNRIRIFLNKEAREPIVDHNKAEEEKSRRIRKRRSKSRRKDNIRKAKPSPSSFRVFTVNEKANSPFK
ncbi:hypothetical protein L596_019173 [Steinernema carpocapsae]|uniref:Protein ABHD13 n=1 Tax=Steinernema carpocapsae TaxID=34508 RepID=A0A4U5N973_STECR|nr:hypothetical protein L596_019173 [Steinernema carpocapsae]